jgi:hypothetical protein
MSRYDHDYYDSNDCNCGGKRKASATAKTALGLAIGGLSLAAVNGGLLGGNNGCDCTGNNGGLLGNLFGNRGNSCYCKEKYEQGARAVTELQMLEKWILPEMNRTCALERFAAVSPLATEMNMLEKYIFPIMHRTCELEKESAVNKAVDEKNQVINGLLFAMAQQRTDAKFDLADCRTNGKFDLVQSQTGATFELTKQRTDAEFALSRALTTADIEKATCNVVRGKPYISPCQMADPYNAGMNVLMSRHINGVATANIATYGNDCGCGCQGAWSGCTAAV